MLFTFLRLSTHNAARQVQQNFNITCQSRYGVENCVKRHAIGGTRVLKSELDRMWWQTGKCAAEFSLGVYSNCNSRYFVANLQLSTSYIGANKRANERHVGIRTLSKRNLLLENHLQNCSKTRNYRYHSSFLRFTLLPTVVCFIMGFKKITVTFGEPPRGQMLRYVTSR